MANYGTAGWIKLYRSELDNDLYFSEPFTKWQAWIDLCIQADSSGIIRTSLRCLKTRWLWKSEHKVRDLLGALEGAGMVTVKGTPNKGTLIRINSMNSDKRKHASGAVSGTVSGADKGIEEDFKRNSENSAGSQEVAGKKKPLESNAIFGRQR